MPKVKNPVLSVREIVRIRPGETLEMYGIDDKKMSSITTMVNYVKNFHMPWGVMNYRCSYDRKGRKCKITAF